MGYRSDVAITLYEEDFETLIKKASEECKDVLELIGYATLYKNDSNNSVSLTWSSIKWYDGFEDIDYIMHFIRSEDRQYQFKRIGEELGDIETECNDDNWELGNAVYVECYLSTNEAGEEVDAKSSVESVLQKQSEEAENDDNDKIEDVSETELFDVIDA